MIFPRMRVFRRMLDRIAWDGMFRGRFEDRAFAIDAFNRHNEQVRRDVPAERLLVYQVSEGWEPLCAFLGVSVPRGEAVPASKRHRRVPRSRQARRPRRTGHRICRTRGDRNGDGLACDAGDPARIVGPDTGVLSSSEGLIGPRAGPPGLLVSDRYSQSPGRHRKNNNIPFWFF